MVPVVYIGCSLVFWFPCWKVSICYPCHRNTLFKTAHFHSNIKVTNITGFNERKTKSLSLLPKRETELVIEGELYRWWVNDVRASFVMIDQVSINYVEGRKRKKRKQWVEIYEYWFVSFKSQTSTDDFHLFGYFKCISFL